MLAIIPEDEVTETDISVEDAMKLIFSGGIVLPEMMRVGDQVGFAHHAGESDNARAQQESAVRSK